MLRCIPSSFSGIRPNWCHIPIGVAVFPKYPSYRSELSVGSPPDGSVILANVRGRFVLSPKFNTGVSIFGSITHFAEEPISEVAALSNFFPNKLIEESNCMA